MAAKSEKTWKVSDKVCNCITCGTKVKDKDSSLQCELCDGWRFGGHVWLAIKFNKHIDDKINKVYSFLGKFKRNCNYLCKDAWITLYKSLVRSHLECDLTTLTWEASVDRISKLEFASHNTNRYAAASQVKVVVCLVFCLLLHYIVARLTIS